MAVVTTPMLEIRDLTLRFGGMTAINNVGFTVNAGELFAIIGPNGAGKTSIFNCLSGVYRPQVGEIRFQGEDLRGKRPDQVAQLGIARMFQNIELFDNLTVLDNLMLGRHQHLQYGTLAGMFYAGKARRVEIENRRAVEDIIDFLEIEAIRRSLVGMLPYGLKKRVELGRALAMAPRLLLLDEPVAGMSDEETERTAELFLTLAGEHSLVVVEHDMAFVKTLGGKVTVLHEGSVLAEGALDVVQNDDCVIEVYLGR